LSALAVVGFLVGVATPGTAVVYSIYLIRITGGGNVT